MSLPSMMPRSATDTRDRLSAGSKLKQTSDQSLKSATFSRPPQADRPLSTPTRSRMPNALTRNRLGADHPDSHASPRSLCGDGFGNQSNWDLSLCQWFIDVQSIATSKNGTRST